MLRCIGLLGGMSWESSAIYYRRINELVRRELGGLHSAKVILYSVDFAEIAELQARGDWGSAAQLLATAAERLHAAGAECIVLCTNTMHMVADTICNATPLPFLHITDITAEAVKAAGHKRVALLGTRFTMQNGFFVERLEKLHQLEVLLPTPEDQEHVHNIIFHELCLGKVLQASRDCYLGIISKLEAQGAEAVLLSCTEITMLIKESDLSMPIFDSTHLHALAATTFSLGKIS